MKNLFVMIVAAGLSSATWANAITVGGTGVVKARPDCVSLTFEVSVVDKRMEDAFAKLKEKNEALAAALGAAEVRAEEIKISNLRMNPQYSYGSMSGRTFEGYRQACTYVVTLPLDMVRVQSIYRAVVGTKAGEEISLNFFIADDRPHRDEAKRRAVKDAMGTAELLAEAAGVTLGRIEEISYQAGGVMPLRSNAAMAKLALSPSADGMGLASTEVDDIVISESVVIIRTIE